MSGYSVTFTDSVHAAKWYTDNLVLRELHRKCDEIMDDANGRPIRAVRFEVDFADEVSERVGLEREGWDTPPEAA